MTKYFVYLLKSLKDQKYYIGQTDNVDKRLKQHNGGYNRSTKSRRPFILVGCEEYGSQNQARWMENEFKKHGDKKRRFIEKLVKENSR